MHNTAGRLNTRVGRPIELRLEDVNGVHPGGRVEGHSAVEIPLDAIELRDEGFGLNLGANPKSADEYKSHLYLL